MLYTRAIWASKYGSILLIWLHETSSYTMFLIVVIQSGKLAKPQSIISNFLSLLIFSKLSDLVPLKQAVVKAYDCYSPFGISSTKESFKSINLSLVHPSLGSSIFFIFVLATENYSIFFNYLKLSGKIISYVFYYSLNSFNWLNFPICYDMDINWFRRKWSTSSFFNFEILSGIKLILFWSSCKDSKSVHLNKSSDKFTILLSFRLNLCKLTSWKMLSSIILNGIG